MNPTIFHKFSLTVDWLTNAIIEKIEGRLPNKDELQRNLVIVTDQKGAYEISWRTRIIMRANLESPEENVYSGLFEIEAKYLDEYITARTTNWI